MSDGTSWFLESIGRVPLLTASQEITLGRHVQEWMALREFQDNQNHDQQLSLLTTEVSFDFSDLTDKDIRRISRLGRRSYDRMYSSNLRLVVHLAKKYANSTNHLELMDLIQEGSIGLARAVEKFDPTRGFKFSTYAYWWIRQSITRAISQMNHTIRLPVNTIEKVGKIRQFSTDYFQQFGRYPNSELVCETFEIHPADLDRINMVAMGCRSLHETAWGSDSDSSMLLDIIASPQSEDPDFDEFEKEQVGKAITAVQEHMPETEAEVFKRLFLMQPQQSKAKISRDLGISRERANKCQELSENRIKAFLKMRHGVAA